MRLPTDEKTWRYLWWCGVGLLFTLTYLIAPIADPDFFWHLHTGQSIWEQRGLPSLDPFSFSAPATPDFRQHFILTSYWLSQLFYFFVYSFSGWAGFFALRFLLIYIFVRALLSGDHASPLAHSIVTSCFLVAFFAQYPAERPQFFSFIAFAVLLALLNRLADARENRLSPRIAWGLPVLMLIWSNLHGGVLLGQLLCVLYLLNGLWQYYTKEITARFFLHSSAVICGGIALSLVNPNGFHYYKLIPELLAPTYPTFMATNLEYQSIDEMIFRQGQWIYLYYPVTVLLAAFSLIRRVFRHGIGGNLLPLLLVGALTFYAFKHIRYLAFLGIITLPLASSVFTTIKKRLPLVVLIIAFVLCLTATSRHFKNIHRLSESGPVSKIYPQRAVDFIKRHSLQGNIFNEYSMGGFLGWALGPGYKVFIDGRNLETEPFMYWGLLYAFIEKTHQASGKTDDSQVEGLFSRITTKFKIDYVILPKVSEGKPFPLTLILARNSMWEIIYEDQAAAVFVKNRWHGRQGF